MKNKIHMIIEGREKNIGIDIRRVLPWAKKRMVGPFIFLDEMGPANFVPPEDHMDVRPHPHIGLSTLTYLFEGEILHRDSLGVVQPIRPGEVNWMTAGKGIAHSERESDEARKRKRTIHGLQFWVALPKEKEDIDPSFDHYDQKDIPKHDTGSAVIDVIAGSSFGKTSPLRAHSPMTFMLLRANKEGSIAVPSNGQELALYVVKGSVQVNGQSFDPHTMVVFEKDSEIEFIHAQDALVAVIGGVPFEEERFIWWNFVSSSKDKIEAAKKAWEDNTFPQVPGDFEKIPLPSGSSEKWIVSF